LRDREGMWGGTTREGCEIFRRKVAICVMRKKNRRKCLADHWRSRQRNTKGTEARLEGGGEKRWRGIVRPRRGLGGSLSHKTCKRGGGEARYAARADQGEELTGRGNSVQGSRWVFVKNPRTKAGDLSQILAETDVFQGRTPRERGIPKAISMAGEYVGDVGCCGRYYARRKLRCRRGSSWGIPDLPEGGGGGVSTTNGGRRG